MLRLNNLLILTGSLRTFHKLSAKHREPLGDYTDLC